MLKIGDFSRLSRISVRMLRHYDEIGLLRPRHIDPDTLYRYDYHVSPHETDNPDEYVTEICLPGRRA